MNNLIEFTTDIEYLALSEVMSFRSEYKLSVRGNNKLFSREIFIGQFENGIFIPRESYYIEDDIESNKSNNLSDDMNQRISKIINNLRIKFPDMIIENLSVNATSIYKYIKDTESKYKTDVILLLEKEGFTFKKNIRKSKRECIKIQDLLELLNGFASDRNLIGLSKNKKIYDELLYYCKNNDISFDDFYKNYRFKKSVKFELEKLEVLKNEIECELEELYPHKIINNIITQYDLYLKIRRYCRLKDIKKKELYEELGFELLYRKKLK